MAEPGPRERLQPSLLDRLSDEERVATWRLDEVKTKLLSILNDDEKRAYAKLFDVEARTAPKLMPKDLVPFDRLDENGIELLQQAVELEQRQRFESREQRVMSLERLRDSVIRDLHWLLNTEYLEAVRSLDDYPNVKTSVLNYGIPSIVGLTLTDLTDQMKGGLSKMLRDAITQFEPRLRPDSINVRISADREEMSTRSLSFEIEAELDAEPAPLHLLLKSIVDLEDGHATLSESGG